jgi:DNA-binding GntR family transcriptional regulator
VVLLRDSVYQAIRSSILTCEFRPGQELREQLLAERYRVSRSPIRDSLLRLEQENLVTVLPRQGYRVNPISLSDAEDILGFRMLIQPACAARAARRDDVTVGALDRFRGYVDDGSTKNNYIDYNRAFHGAVADMSGNARMAAVEHALAEEFDRLVRFSHHYHQLIKIDEMIHEHEAMIDAIQAHDVDRACRLAYQHAEHGRLRILVAFRPGGKTSDDLIEPAPDSADDPTSDSGEVP